MVVGGKTANDVGKLYFQPTLLANVTDEMDIVHQEVFGPVISMIPWVVLSIFSADIMDAIQNVILWSENPPDTSV